MTEDRFAFGRLALSILRPDDLTEAVGKRVADRYLIPDLAGRAEDLWIWLILSSDDEAFFQ